MSELDHWLDALGAQPTDPRLATLDTRILAGVTQRQEARAARRGIALATVLALGIGIIGSTLPRRRHRARRRRRRSARRTMPPPTCWMAER